MEGARAMNLPGIITLWLASGLAMAYAAYRFGGDVIKQVVRSRASRRTQRRDR
jgi:hypothetical protein